MLESLFNKAAKTPTQMFFYEYCEILRASIMKYISKRLVLPELSSELSQTFMMKLVIMLLTIFTKYFNKHASDFTNGKKWPGFLKSGLKTIKFKCNHYLLIITDSNSVCAKLNFSTSHCTKSEVFH